MQSDNPAAAVHLPAGTRARLFNILDHGHGNDTGGLLSRRKHLQLHQLALEGERRTVSEPYRHQHRTRDTHDPLQLLVLRQPLHGPVEHRRRGPAARDTPLGRVQDHIHPAGHPSHPRHPDGPLSAENSREAQETHADIQHTLLHRDDSALVHGQHRRVPEVHQIHLSDRSDT